LVGIGYRLEIRYSKTGRGEIFYAVQTNSKDSVQWVPGLFTVAKEMEGDTEHQTLSSAEVKEKLELYFYSLPGFWPVIRILIFRPTINSHAKL
jgi:hypothetical protein